MSHVMCHVSHVTFFFFLSFFILLFLDKVVKLVGGGSVINGAYPVYFFSMQQTNRGQLTVVALYASHEAPTVS